MPGSGLFATFGYAAEDDWGTFEAPDHFLTMLKEEGEYKKTTVQATTLDGQLYDDVDRRSVVKIGATQTVDLNIFDRGLGLLLNNAMGANAVSGTAVYTQVFTPADTTGNSLSIQVGRPMTNNTTYQAVSYEGCKITEWSIGAKAGALSTFTCTFDAKEEDVSQDYTAASYTSSSVLTAVQANLLLGGTVSTTDGVTSVSDGVSVALTKDVSIKFTNPNDDARYFLGSAYKAEQLVNKKRQVKGSCTIQFNDLTTAYDGFTADTPTALQFVVTGPVVHTSTHSAVSIIIPNIFWDTDKFPAQGTELIDQSLTFTGLYDGTNNAVQVTLVTLDATI